MQAGVRLRIAPLESGKSHLDPLGAPYAALLCSCCPVAITIDNTRNCA